MYQDSFSIYFTPVYFIWLVLIWSFFILNLTVAIMLDKYEELSNRSEDYEVIQELLDMGRESNLPEHLCYFLIQHDIKFKKRKQAAWYKGLK